MCWVLVAVLLFIEAAFQDDRMCQVDEDTCEDSLTSLLLQRQRATENSSLGCNTTDQVKFCWWAVEVVNPDWKLYRNGMSSLLETNMAPFCNSTNATYGFSDTYNVHDRSEANLQKILIDMFYYCCSTPTDCGKFSDGLLDKDIIHKLADAMLPHIVTASITTYDTRRPSCPNDDDTFTPLLPGVKVCVFLADVGTDVKVYSGPMMFSHFDLYTQSSEREKNSLAVLALQGNFCLSAAPLSDDYGSHLRDGDCVTYISAMEYFIYCCCYVDGGRCAYTNNDRAQMFTTRNKPIWERHAELWLMKNVRRIDGRIIGAQLFTYRDFLFSEPTAINEIKIAGKSNVRLWHCAYGTYQMNSDSGSSSNSQMRILQRSDLPDRWATCLFALSINFMKNAVSSVNLTYGGTHELRHCGAMECRLAQPTCLNDLIDNGHDNVDVTIECCCDTSNLCNHAGTRNEWITRFIRTVNFTRTSVGGSYQQITHILIHHAAPRFIFCLHYLDPHTGEEEFMLDGQSFYVPKKMGESYTRKYFHITRGNETAIRFRILTILPLQQRKCSTSKNSPSYSIAQFVVIYCAMHVTHYGRDKPCDENFKRYIPLALENLKRPSCYNGTLKADFSNSDVQVVETGSSPLCVDEAYVYADGTIVLHSYPFDAGSPGNSLRLRYVKPEASLDKDGHSFSFTIHLCIAELNRPCNGAKNIFSELLPRLLNYNAMEEAKSVHGVKTIVQRIAQPLSRCRVGDNEMSCSTRSGCFEFRNLDETEPLRGCIEDVPKYVKQDASLRSVLNCRSQLLTTESYKCAAIVDSSHSAGRMGVLCCCKRKCPAPIKDSPTSIERGFTPFYDIV
uniref:ZP domain-containing protein n=1 Tax=Ascaris lumbricoides TaxID=6252 RepID=A0A9J2NQQ0_ASCLU